MFSGSMNLPSRSGESTPNGGPPQSAARGSGEIDGAERRPRAAAGDPPGGLPAPLPGAVLADRSLAVVAAGGLEAALHPEAPHPRREGRLVEVDGAEQAAGRELVAGRAGKVGRQQQHRQQDDRQRDEPAPAEQAAYHGSVPVAARTSQRATSAAAWPSRIAWVDAGSR